MGDLKQRFGQLVAAHRRRLGWTQRALAEAADLDEDSIGRIEMGQRGVSFTTIQKLATALGVDPAELFSADLASGAFQGGTFADVTSRMAALPPTDLEWLKGIIEAALAPRR